MRKYDLCHYLQGIFYVIILVNVFLLLGCNRRAVEGKQIIVVFRYDDYSERSPTDFEIKLIKAFQYYNISSTFAVIPYIVGGNVHDPSSQKTVPLSSTKTKILKTAIKEGVLEVALHGYSHQTIRTEGGYTEFSGLDYDNQLQKIAKAKAFLEKKIGTPISTFVPPWNSYDWNTLQVLENLDFKDISASRQGDAKESPLKFLPVTCSLLQLQDAVKLARNTSSFQSVIVVLFHAYDFYEINKTRGKLTYQEFRKLLGWLISQHDVRVMSINRATTMIDDLSAHRLIVNKNIMKLLPPMLVPVGIYLPSDTSLILSLFYYYVTLLFISTAIAFFGGYTFFHRLTIIVVYISRYCVLAILVFLLIYALRDLDITYRGATLIVVFIGVCIGVWWSSLRLKDRG